MPIPTAFASNEAKGSPRLKLPTSKKKLRNIRLSRFVPMRNKGSSTQLYSQISDGTKRGNARAIQAAVYGKSRFAFLKNTTGGNTGIFHVKGRRKKDREIKMVHDLKHPVVNIPKHAWLTPATDRSLKRMPRMYNRNLKHQIDRARRLNGI